jgi:transcriptional regulator with XRE-family HTH domain
MAQIPEVIRQLRASLSQSEIARRTGISQSKISRWEAGQVADGAEDALKLVDLAEQMKTAVAQQGEPEAKAA